MKIKITQNCYVEGKAAKVGDVVDTDKANLLIGLGKAKQYTKPEPKPEPKQEAKTKRSKK